MTEVNPNHPTLGMLHDHWHKICAVIVHKFGGETHEVVLSAADIIALNDAFGPNGANILVQELDDGIHLTLVDSVVGAARARREGGLPT